MRTTSNKAAAPSLIILFSKPETAYYYRCKYNYIKLWFE